jgi:uncharacterized membrane protein YfcA
MSQAWLAIAIGFAAGLLSGAFGVGGGVVTTPAIRLLLGQPALVAVGTPLLIIIPTALVGSLSYARRGLADVRAGVLIGLWGAAASVLGAYISHAVGGTTIMILTAIIIFYLAYDTALGKGARDAGSPPSGEDTAPSWRLLAVLGVATGLYSGLLGLGGGFILVPMLLRFGGYPIKKAIGTSLTAIAVLAIPGSITHWMLGHVDVRLAVLLSLGVLPGVLVGAKLTAAASERRIRWAFATLLVVAGAALVVAELGAI